MGKLSFLFNAEDTLLALRKWYSKKTNFLLLAYVLFIFVLAQRRLKLSSVTANMLLLNLPYFTVQLHWFPPFHFTNLF